MFKKIFPAAAFIFVFGSCTSLKPLTLNNSRQASAPVGVQGKKEVKFLDISPEDNSASVTAKESKNNLHNSSATETVTTSEIITYDTRPAAESESAIQLKYAGLLNTDAAQVQNMPLYQQIDNWYGTRYKMGGTGKDGIDCSAFVQTIFFSAFGITLPRTAKDQYRITRRISRTQLQEGDLLFFNTRGGISHVGIYLQNNKFVHASVSGVMISDMFETYYVKHFVAAGRINKVGLPSASVRP